MSSTERAPEPTMEEILASIRRIITDDDAGQTRGQNATPQAQQDEEPLEGEGEGEADSQIIDDIARVLSGSGGAVEVTEEEEILDLTAELGGLELVDEDEPLSEPVNAAPMAEEASAEPMVLSERAPEPAPQDEAPVFMPPAPPSPPAQEAAAPQMQMDAPQPPMPEAAPMPPQAAPPAAPQPSASLEAASALERAIAALRAGQVPTSTTPQAEPFQFQAAPQPEPMTPEAMPTPTFMPASEQTAEPEQMAEPVPMAIPMEAPEPQAETHPEMEAEPEPEAFEFAEQAPEPEPVQELEAESEPEAELLLTEVEMTMVSETEELVELEAAEPESEEAAFWPSDAPAWQEDEAAESESVYEAEPAYEPEPVPVAAHTNGHHQPEGATMTLEDSVKDMLRPMLRQWLDENMPRMVTAALKDELDPNAFRQQD